MGAWDVVTSPWDGCQDVYDGRQTSPKRPFGAKMTRWRRQFMRFRTSGCAPP